MPIKNLNSITVGESNAIDVKEIAWNPVDGTFNMGLLNDVVLQAGQEMHFYGKATEAISNGDAVMFAGAEGDHVLIAKATQAVINASPEYFIGVATQNFTTNQYGYVTSFGSVRDLDTTIYRNIPDSAEGNILYFDSAGTTPGALTITEPVAPNAKIRVAAVTRDNANVGVILVRPMVEPKLDQLQDMSIVGKTDGDVLVWNDINKYWFNDSTLNVDYTNGRVGIGTTDPDSILHLKSSTAPELKLESSVTTYNTVSSKIGFYGGYDSNLEIASIRVKEFSSGGIGGGLGIFTTVDPDTPQEIITINSLGRVGIGTTGPSEKLHVSGNILATGTILGSNLSGTNTGDQDLSVYYTKTESDSRFVNVTGDTMTGDLILDNSGQGWIKGYDAYHSIKFRAGGTNKTEYYEYGGTLADGLGHKFFTGGTTGQTLKFQVADDGSYFSGNVGIGTNSPGEKLTVSGNISATGTITGSNLSGTNTGDQDLSGYLTTTGKAADSNLLDGIDSSGFVKQLSDITSPNYTTPSSRRVNPNADNPTNEYYAITTFGNNGNVTGQLATHFVSGLPYTRGFNASWSSWRKIWTDANDGSGSGLDADTLDGQHASAFLTSLPSHNHDERYFRRFYGTAAGVSNAGFTTAFTVDGGNLASSIRMSVQGTVNAVVVSNLVDIVVNHSEDIMIKSLSGIYTKLTLKVVSNNNEDFAVELKTNSVNVANLSIEVLCYGAETVTFTNSHSYTGSTLEKELPPGEYISGTGGNNGDSIIDGNVSIGTATVAAANAAADDLHLKSLGSNGITISSGNAQTGTIFFGDQSNAAVAGFRYNHNTGDMAISAEDNITFACDNVGIGTTSPTDKLQIDASNSQLRLRDTDDGTYTQFSSSSNKLAIRQNSTSASHIWLTSSGNVGIGTDNPSEKLVVAGNIETSTAAGKIGFNVGDSYGDYPHYGLGKSNSASPVNLAGYYGVTIGSAGAERMRITQGGNVGIGTTSPTAPLHVIGTVRMGNTSEGLTFSADSGIGNIIGVDTGFAGYNAIALKASANTGIYLDTADNVGIGTTSPGAKLDVVGLVGGDPILKLQRNGVAAYDYFISDTGDGAAQLFHRALNNDTGFIFQTKSSGGSTINAFTLAPSGNVGIGTTSPSYKLHVNGSFYAFGTTTLNTTNVYGSMTWFSPGGLMNFDVNGNLGIGTVSAGEKLSVDGLVGSTGGLKIIDSYGSPTISSYYGVLTTSASLYVGLPWAGLDCNASAFNITSDYRLKENVVKLTGAIDKLKNLKPVRFNFKNTEKTVNGFIAHEVQEVIPEAVTGDKDALYEDGTEKYQGLDNGKIVPLLTAALQDAIVKIEQLETRIQTLENND